MPHRLLKKLAKRKKKEDQQWFYKQETPNEPTQTYRPHS